MNYDQIRTFVTIVECGSFRAAADHLFRTQPAITNAIKTLEERLGFQLFDRDAYRASLTENGEAFYEKAKLLVLQMADLTKFQQQLKQGLEANVSIAIDIACPLNNYLPIFSEFVDKYPATKFYFCSEALSGPIEQLLLENVIIALSENLAKPDDVTAVPLQNIAMIPVASPDFIEKNKSALADEQKLKQLVQVIITDSSRAQHKHSCGMIKDARHWTVSDIYSKKKIIKSGIGWGRLPEHSIAKELKSGSLKMLEDDHFDTRHMQLSAVKLKGKPLGPIATELWEAITTGYIEEGRKRPKE